MPRHPQGAKPGPQVTSCRDVPVPPDVRGNAMRGAWRKGYKAARAGEPRAMNPYAANQVRFGVVTYRRALARAWGHGWDQGNLA